MHPLNKILSAIPDTDYARDNLLSYADYQASEQSANVTRPKRDFEVKKVLDYFNVLPYSSMVRNFFPQADLPEETGFHFFDVNQTAFYGFLKHSGTILLASFDVETAADTLSQQGYEPQSYEDLMLQTESVPDLLKENPLRHDSIIIHPSTIHSLSRPVLDDYLRTSSLFENPIYQSAASALISSGVIRQVQFIPASRTSQLFIPIIGSGSRVQRMRSRIQNYGHLPAYQLVVMGDIVRNGQQYIEHVLVYADSEQAEQAADELYQRTQRFYKMPEFIEQNSGTLGIRDTSVWGTITLEAPRIHKTELSVVRNYKSSKEISSEKSRRCLTISQSHKRQRASGSK